ncbi:site-specific integrase [Spirosoma sp. BT702]|uniref:Site-specific integrase n=1 Tax=Spirosoma profusum TaxID=2771354 RepID=A0A927ARI8_9BACT|nr:site-specific integrase [Spirosoma profusum]MBD2702311.1 site-specific integrase [Spirosoma profusum]
MTLTFYLKEDQPDKAGRFMIYGRICWLSQKVRFSTGEKVLPNHFKNERVKSSLAAAHINQTLSTFESELTTFFYRNQNDSSAKVLTITSVQAEVERIKTDLLGKKQKKGSLLTPPDISSQPTLFEFFSIYQADMRANRSPEWARSLQAVHKQLETFNSDLTWADLKINILNRFKAYLQEEEELSDNTIHAYICLLRGMCDYAERLDIHPPRDIHWLESSPGEVISPVLEPEDELAIINVKLGKSLTTGYADKYYLEKVRWYFLLACQTGLRRSDQWQFLNPQIQFIENVPCLMALQQKTGNRVAVPLSEFAYTLLLNPATDQRPPDGKNYNATLRQIGQQAGLTRIVTVGSFYKGELLADTMPLYQAMSSHMARRTFATRMTTGGMNTFTLKELMGHKSISSTQKYQSVSNSAIVQQTMEAWQKQQGR